jgi:hypothetical protein
LLKGKTRKEEGNGNGSLASGLPFVTLRFNHWDYDAEKAFGKNETNLFGVDLSGLIKAIRTRYVFVYEFQNYSSPTRSYDAQYMRANTDTNLGGSNLLSTAFQYSKIDISTVTSFTANLDLVHGDRFSQSYYYSYNNVEAGSSSTVTHNAQGIWDYRFAERFFTRGTAFYSLTTTDGEKEDTYGAGAAVRYGKRLTNHLDFSSVYRFAYRNMSAAGNFYENNMELGLRTTKLKWGALYADYSFTQQTSSEQGNLYEHIARVGARGKGPGRAYWNVEAEYTNLNNELGGVSAVLPGGPDELRIAGPQKINYYSLTAEGGYPVGRRGLLSVLGNYTTGTADGQALERYYYEGRLTYLLLRNLSVVGWWREGWDKLSASDFNRKVRVIEGRLYYRLRRLFFSLEYRNWRTDQGPLSTEENRLYLKLTRPI